MNLEQLTIPMWCEHWARWSMRHADQVRGFPSVSMIADKWSFQDTAAPKPDAVGNRPVTARGTETKTHRGPEIPDDILAEVLDDGISRMGLGRPDLQIVIGAEYLGGFPELYVERWTAADAALKKFVRLQAAWKAGRGFEVNYLLRKEKETTDMWRARLAGRLGISRTKFYELLAQAHIYLWAWRDTELQRAVAEAEKVA